MANGQIDIIVAKKALAELDVAIKNISLANDEVIKLSKSVRELNTTFSQIKTPKDLDERLKKNAEGQKKVTESVEKVRLAEIKLAQDREKAFDKFEKNLQKANSDRLKESRAINMNKIALDKQRKSMLETNRAYRQLSLSAVKARKNAQDLGATYGTTSKQFKIAATEANRLNDRLKRIDAATGVYTRSVGNYGQALRGAIGFTKQMVGALGLMGGAFLAVQVIRNVVKTIKEFNKETAVLASVLQKSRKEIAPLIKNAKELGATTAKTANEVVKLQVAYARLGFTQKEILALTEATIEGSIALNAELDETAELTGAIVNSMDALSAIDAPEIMDIMSLATAKSALNFEKLSTGLPIVLGAANALNIPFTKVVATLGKLADAGIETSTSATSLRNIFIESAKQGIDYEKALAKINKSQNKLTTANEIFGKRAAVSALVIANNTDNLDKLNKVLEDAIGTAKEMADVQLDTVAGEITLMESAWSGFILSVEDGEGSFAKASRGIIGSITGIFNALTDINELTEVLDKGDLSGNILGIPFFNFIKNAGKASAQLRFLNADFIDLRSSGLEDLTDAFVDYEKKLGIALETDEIYAKLLEFQLTRIEGLVEAKRAQIRIDEASEDALFEQRQSIIDVLLELDKKIKLEDLEKKTLKELTALLNKYNDESQIIEGSISSIREIIKANSELIEATDDNTYRSRLLQENQLLNKQIKLLLKVPSLVKAIQIATPGVTTLEEAARPKPLREGTAQGGGSGIGELDILETKLKGLIELRDTLTGTQIEDTQIDEQIKQIKSQIEAVSDVLQLTGTPLLGAGIETGASQFESVLDDVNSFVEEYGESINTANEITNSFFDNRIDKIQRDIDASNAFFEAQIELAEGNEAEQDRLEAERELKEAQLQKKKQKEVEKQAIFNKAIAVATISLNTANAITAALAPPPIGLGPVAGIPLAIATGVLGAAQLAVAIAQPIPKFKEGTKAPLSKDTLAITGDGGKHEPITKEGKLIGISPDTSTLTMLPKGAEVHKDLESLHISEGFDMDSINRAAVMSSIFNDSIRLSNIELGNIFKDTLDKYQGRIQKEIKQGFKNAKISNTSTTNFDHSIYRNDTL